jgi:hypothetical protein
LKLKGPLEMVRELLKESNVECLEECPLFDSLYVRLLSEYHLVRNPGESMILQMISIEAYNYLSKKIFK